ncbi:hypothetical protein BZG04_08875 [Salinivibrio kushneri]|uniref:hypothetical protein n=1 Tax=Salinivibrio kushneri TaxID=1908198 RepID=UPI000988FCC7|nr:hypothetical protein [Salinivibrio kushneri]OOE35507.1 hypothetical protein BZG04_08875 [Salinivibrio kushneri]
MQTIRSNLTRLKRLAEKNLPEGDDIFGYSGISKSLIIDFIDHSYELSYELVDLEPHFEITVLKRKISKLISVCKGYLNDDAKGFLKEKKFDAFIDSLTEIRDQVRFTYIVVVDKSLRKEAAAAEIKENYERLKKSYEEFEDRFRTVDQSLQSVTENQEKIEEVKNELLVLLETSRGNSDDISSFRVECESNNESIEKHEDEARSKKEFLIESSEKLNNLITKSQDLKSESDSMLGTINSLSEELNEQIQLNSEKQKEIQDTLGNANRVGMAGSFKTRKEELNKPILMWGAIFALAIVLIFSVAVYFITPALKSDGDIAYWSIFTKLLLATPFVWLAWMSAKQYGYLSRIREDYAYKYASAMAFEGYKKHAIEVQDGLLHELLSISIANLSQNPIRLFQSKDNHASPINELVKEVFGRVSKSNSDKNR